MPDDVATADWTSCEDAEQKSTMYIHGYAFLLILIHSPLSVSVAHVTPQRT